MTERQTLAAKIALRAIARAIGLVGTVGAVLAAGLYLTGMAIGLLPGPWTCLTVARENVSRPSGMTFEMVYVNCDLIAKWERVSIYAKQRGNIRKTLVFEYAPVYYEPLPQITVPNDQDILISVASIGSINLQLDRWNGHRILYRIEKIYYPDNPMPAERK